MHLYKTRRTLAGFTLLELMIVGAIVAILATLAVTSYLRYAQQSRRSDALAGMTQDQGILERCYAQTFDYSKVTTASSGCGSLSSSAGNPSPKDYYTVALAFPAAAGSSTGATAYTLTATPVAGSPQANDAHCATFILDSAHGRSAQDSSGSDQTATCWQQ
jgi:type IV pilus assembly protein PilE